jgi:hypothetical protein
MTWMKQRTTLIVALAALFLLPLRGFADRAVPTLQDRAAHLYASLSDEQKKQATLPFDSPERAEEVFTGGERAGIQIRKLNDEQRKMALELLTMFTSDYGKQKAIAIADQKPDNPAGDPGIGRYYVCFFGEPGPGKTYAWRIAEHHLTLVHVGVEKGKPTTFGPILLGANPPVLWDDEEEKMIALYRAMTPDERQKSAQRGRGISAAEFKNGGVKVADLSPSAKEAVKSVMESRLKFYSEPIRAEVRHLIDSQGGIDAMHLGFWGAAEKKCRDGGKWDFKLAGPSFLCDYENTRGHIHLSMKGQVEK